MWEHGCQMAIARFFLDRMCLALRASGLWLRYTALQNLIPSFPWMAPSALAQSKERKGSKFNILQPSPQNPQSPYSSVADTPPPAYTAQDNIGGMTPQQQMQPPPHMQDQSQVGEG